MLIDLLYRREHIGLGRSYTEPPAILNLYLNKPSIEGIAAPTTAETPKRNSNQKRPTQPDLLDNTNHFEAGPSAKGEHETLQSNNTSRDDCLPDDDDGDVDVHGNEDKDNVPRDSLFGHENGLNPKRPDFGSPSEAPDPSPGEYSSTCNKGLGVRGLMKAYYGKPTFSGNWEEY